MQNPRLLFNTEIEQEYYIWINDYLFEECKFLELSKYKLI